jgi:hypothetical protein
MRNDRPSKESRLDPERSGESPSWREFERVVTRVEAALAPRSAVVCSPDRIRDQVTGGLREVDASIRYTVGTTPVLIIIECRERNRQQDSRWIEQLSSKQQAVGAAKCVAVSSTGFTNAAIAKARSLGIELRQLQEFDHDTIAELAPLRTWFYGYSLSYVDPSFCRPGDIRLDAALDRKLNRAFGKANRLDDKFLISRESGVRVSLRMYIERFINISFERMSPSERNKIPIGQELCMGFAFPPSEYARYQGQEYDLLALGIRITFNVIRDYAFERRAPFNYDGPSGTLVAGREFAGIERVTGERLRAAVHEARDGRTVVSLWDESGELIARSEGDA